MPEPVVIGVCGPIGAGKTTATRALASALGLEARLERVDENPFFTRYMADHPRWALQSQLAFLIGAIEDATAARHKYPGGVLERPMHEMLGVFVADMHAVGLLDDDEVRILQRLGKMGEVLTGVPDLLVMLHGDPPRLLERIRERERPGEDAYELSDMQRLAQRYDGWRTSWDRCPVIDVDTTETDLRGSAEIDRLAAAARAALKFP